MFGSTPKTPIEAGPPRFCPRCGRRPAGDRLCEHCGESIEIQGFCAICERHWKQAVGSICPKHEVELIAHQGPMRTVLEPHSPTQWETIGVFGHAFEAGAARVRLEAEGIPTFLDGERMASHHSGAMGGVRLQVPRRSVDEARAILARRFDDEELVGEWGDDPEDEGEEQDSPDARGWLGSRRIVVTLGVLLLLWLVAKLLS